MRHAILWTTAFMLIGGCSPNTVTTTLSELVAPGAEVHKLPYDPFVFTEGPATDGHGNIYFTDVRAARIYKIAPDHMLSLVREQSNGCNGLMFNEAGELIGCEGGAARLVAMSPDGAVLRVLADAVNDHGLNSPNDLTIDRDGGVYFTDPSFGRRDTPMPNVEAVFYLAPGAPTPVLVVDDVSKPNGVLLSTDGNVLYVVNSFSDTIRGYQLARPGVVDERRNFGTLQMPGNLPAQGGMIRSGGDGLTQDERGNLYVTSLLGIQVFNSSGERLGVIAVPEKAANCVIGGPENQTLYITAQTSVYTLPLKVHGAGLPPAAAGGGY